MRLRLDSKEAKWGVVVLTLWTLVLLGLLLAPSVPLPIPHGFKYFDKVAHVGLFGVTVCVSVFGSKFFSRFKLRLLFGIILSLFLAAGTEFVQSFSSTRTADPYDFLCDLVGLFLGLLLYAMLYSRKGLRSRLKL
jgi:VanZ family protein